MESINRYAVSDVYEIVMNMSKENRKKIPEKAMNFLKENRYKDYKTSIDFTKPIQEQKLSKDTMSLLTMYYMMCFCESKAQRMKILSILKENKNKGDN